MDGRNMPKHIVEIKYGFAKLVAIFYLLQKIIYIDVKLILNLLYMKNHVQFNE